MSKCSQIHYLSSHSQQPCKVDRAGVIMLISLTGRWGPEMLSDPPKVTQPLNRRVRLAAPTQHPPHCCICSEGPRAQPARGTRVQSRENKAEPFISRLQHLIPRQAPDPSPHGSTRGPSSARHAAVSGSGHNEAQTRNWCLTN